MQVQVIPATSSDQRIVKNLFLFYRYDLMPFVDSAIGGSFNPFGILGDADVDTHEMSVSDLDIWWSKPGVLFPMLIRVDGIPAGLAMVAKPPHAHPTVDFRMEDFFVANCWRGKGVGSAAVGQIFGRHAGVWELGWLPRNKGAEQFWRRVLPKLATSVQDWGVVQGHNEAALPGLRVETVARK